MEKIGVSYWYNTPDGYGHVAVSYMDSNGNITTIGLVPDNTTAPDLYSSPGDADGHLEDSSRDVADQKNSSVIKTYWRDISGDASQRAISLINPARSNEDYGYGGLDNNCYHWAEKTLYAIDGSLIKDYIPIDDLKKTKGGELYIFYRKWMEVDNCYVDPEIAAFAPNLVDEFRQGCSGAHTIQRYDPLSLDLDGDGLETTAAHTAGVLFDHDGDGIAHGSGWIAADDGLLVLDRNGNGRIDTGAELFGDHTDTRTGQALNGFAPLIELDDNGDGRVDAQDARFSALRVWRDLNQNGVSESNELFSLASLGIRALNVAYSAGNTVLANGNVIAETGTFTRTDGSSGTLADVNLLGDATRSRFSDNIPATETAGALPCIRHAQSRQRKPRRSRPTPWRAPRTARNSCFRRAYTWRARTWRSTAIPWRSRWA